MQSGTPLQEKPPVQHDSLERILDELAQRVAPDEIDEVAALLWRCYDTTPADELQETPAEMLVGPVVALWRLARQRRSGETLIRVYNPQRERDGWTSPHTAIDVINDDMPFLLATITGELTQQRRRMHVVLHPVLGVDRDDAGGLKAVHHARQGRPESWMHLEIDRDTPAGQTALEARLREVFGKVRIAVDDWLPMQDRVRAILERLDTHPPPLDSGEVAESRAFLRWLLDDHFTFLGYRGYRLVQRDGGDFLELEPGSGLGLLREVTRNQEERATAPLPDYLARFLRQRSPLLITKSSRRAEVHRPVHMDSVGVRRFDEDGNVVGEDRFLGIFTTTAYNSPAQSIPLLRRKVRRVVERAAFVPGSHDAKTLVQVLEAFPRDELFQIGEEDLYRIALGILALQNRQRVALYVRQDELERFISALVFVPRERYTSDLRERIQKIVEDALGGEVTAFYTQLTDAPLARVQYIVRTTPGQIPPIDLKSVERRIAAAARSWAEDLRDELVDRLGEEEGLAKLAAYEDAFPAGYRDRFTAAEAREDIAALDRLIVEAVAGAPAGPGAGFEVRFHRPADAAPGAMRVKLYLVGRQLALTDALPLLENLGVRVEEELPFEVDRDGPKGTDPPVWIHDFALQATLPSRLPFEEAKPLLEETLRRVWRGDLEDGVLNRAVLACGLPWRDVAMLRTYSRYLRQTGMNFSQRYIAATLVAHPELARQLVALFHALFDPARREDFRSRAAAALAELRQGLDEVKSLDEDRILRGLLSVMKETLRTNFFQPDPSGAPKPYISIKLDSRSIRILPEPRPMFEIFVYSPRMEGVHLRGGKVARGGIRWSDRREDFRTEILGLLKAQMVKNAVIVPVGAKGGFVVKRPPAAGGREAQLAEGIECYKTLIRGMLDLTDNIVDGQVVPPRDVVRRDGDDTYLVVAADKGTATFSDIANGLSGDYGHWLGDAFASGGSAGYDHKEMGITARGAWEAVKRHFRELGKDIQSEDFTVVGVGDMSGDVFGNGMLLSDHIELLGAFDHRHVMIDPDPDPARSLAERRRLFALPRSSWADYDAAALSPGGGVYERSAKQIVLSDEAAAVFKLGKKKVTPNELIQALLTAEAELLWLGGIGTFVKSSKERNGDVGDRANDAVRVDATALRCKVVGEGANLGFTQRARIEYALAGGPGGLGGKINTDAIDNSAGVDTSDHEVNIKIALNEPMKSGALAREERDRLLVEMTDEVAALVLRDNYLQTQAISLAELRSADLLDEQARMVRAFEKSGRLDRKLEFLPDEEELRLRAAQRKGLARPELAVLLAYSKIALYEDLLASDVPDDPLLGEDLLRYFPRAMVERFRPQVEAHRLRREIIATYITNSTVNRVGPSFVFRMIETSGRTSQDVARAYTITRDCFDLRRLWAEIEALDNRVPAALQVRMLLDLGRLTEHATLWFLQRHEGALDVSKVVETLRGPLRELSRSLEELLPATAKRDLKRHARELAKQGVPEELARRVAASRQLVAGPEIVRLALGADTSVERVARVYWAVGERFALDWLRGAASQAKIETPWQRAALEVLLDELARRQSAIARQALAEAPAGTEWREVVERWAAARAAGTDRACRLVDELRAVGSVDLAMLTLALAALERLAAE